MKKFAWNKDQILALFGAALFQLALVGTLVNASGVLLSRVLEEYNFSMLRYSSFNMIRNLGGAVLAPAYSYFFFKKSPKVTMAVSVALIAAGYLILLFGANTFLWFVSPIMLTSVGTVGVYGIVYSLRPWFPEGFGTASGIAMTFSGVGGILFNPLTAKLIMMDGWRFAIKVESALTLLIGALSMYLLFRKEAPFAESQEERETASGDEKPRFKVGLFIIGVLCFQGGIISLQFVPFASIYAESFGYTLMQGATLTSWIMAGNIIMKLIFGWGCDRFGAWKTTAGSYAAVTAGMFLLMTMQSHYALLCAGAFLFGTIYGLNSLAVTRCSMAMYGMKESSRYVGIHSAINNIFSAAMVLVFGYLNDKQGNFTTMCVICFAVSLISTIVAFSQMLKERKLQP
ncbi:MAG: MFS transporter [Oscillospiraceae bacterium]|nr:MFS transporter [Oscillospiraceae bacterium]